PTKAATLLRAREWTCPFRERSSACCRKRPTTAPSSHLRSAEVCPCTFWEKAGKPTACCSRPWTGRRAKGWTDQLSGSREMLQVKEILQQLLARLGQDRLRMELHTLQFWAARGRA